MADDGLRALRSADTEQVGAFYDEWAQTYDKDLADYGYKAPQWVAEALAELVADQQAPILDAGCGTGLTGDQLRFQGYKHLTGIDVSADSLELARAKTCYEQLQQQDLDKELALESNRFAAVSCVGTLAYVKYMQGLMSEFCRVTRPGGFVVFTQSGDFYDEAFSAVLEQLVDNGSWQRRARTGPHAYLPHHPDYGDGTLIYIDTFEVLR